MYNPCGITAYINMILWAEQDRKCNDNVDSNEEKLHFLLRNINFNFRVQKSRCVCETLTMPPVATKSTKAIFRAKVSQGHKVIDLGVISKGIISGVCMPNMKYLPLTVQKL